MRTIAIDAMGGENAPDAIVKAVLQAKTGMPETKFLLFGDKEALRKLIPEDQINDQLGVVPTTEVIADEDEPVKAIRKRKIRQWLWQLTSLRKEKLMRCFP